MIVVDVGKIGGVLKYLGIVTFVCLLWPVAPLYHCSRAMYKVAKHT